jgi:hypothetical protein
MKTPLVSVLKIGHKDTDGYDIVLKPVSRDSEGRVFSPFFLGPVSLPSCVGGPRDVFHNFENAWQYSKVYPKAGHLDWENNITDKYLEWRQKGVEMEQAQRYPMGRGQVPAFSVFGRRRLSYITARKVIYTPFYARLIADVPMLAELRAEYRKGAKILLLDFDASIDQSKAAFDELINWPHRKMGHSYVLRESIIRDDPNWYRKIIL